MRRARTTWVFVTATLLAGCGMRLMHYADYRGDGTFKPYPAPAWICQDGYVLDLGPVDLGVPNALDRALAGLPPVEATIGLSVQRRNGADAAGEVFGADRPSALVEVTLRDTEGRIVLSRHERLTQWIAERSSLHPERAYFYQRGTEAEIPVAPGAVRVERFPLGAEDSWGTYFTPRRGAHYTLHFAIEEPSDASELRDVEVRLQLHAVVGCL